MRSACLLAPSKLPAGPRSTVQAQWAEVRAAFKLCSGGKKLPFTSRSSGGQGDPFLALAASAALKPHLDWLHAELAAHGGFVMAQADDTHAWGPPDVLHDRIAEFAAKIKATLDVDLCVRKSKALFRPGNDSAHRPPAMKVADSTDDPTDLAFEPGLTINGVPIGSPGYIQHVLDAKVSTIVSDNAEINTLL